MRGGLRVRVRVRVRVTDVRDVRDVTVRAKVGQGWVHVAGIIENESW